MLRVFSPGDVVIMATATHTMPVRHIQGHLLSKYGICFRSFSYDKDLLKTAPSTIPCHQKPHSTTTAGNTITQSRWTMRRDGPTTTVDALASILPTITTGGGCGRNRHLGTKTVAIIGLTMCLCCINSNRDRSASAGPILILCPHQLTMLFQLGLF